MDTLLEKELLFIYNQDIAAKAGVSTLSNIADSLHEKDAFESLFLSKDKFLSEHNENTVLENAMTNFFYKLPNQDIKLKAKEKHKEILSKISKSNIELAKTGAKKIKPGSTVFVHSFTNQVFQTIKEAARYKKFSVFLLDHSPFFWGKKIKLKLEDHNIHVKVFSDLGFSKAIGSADLCLIGAQTILRKRAVLLTGSSYILEEAKKEEVPVYVVANAWKYGHKESPERYINKQIKTKNNEHHSFKKAYDVVSYENITGIISEFGIIKPEFFEEEVRLHHSWMFA